MTHYIEELDSINTGGDYSEEILDKLQFSIELCPWNIGLREKRSLVYETIGQYQSAISDIK